MARPDNPQAYSRPSSPDIMAATIMVLIGAVLAGFAGMKHAAAQFIHPPAFVSGNSDLFQDSPRYELGTNVTIEWSLDKNKNKTDLIFALYYPRTPDHPGTDTMYKIKTSIPTSVTGGLWQVELFGNEKLVPTGEDAMCYLLLLFAGTNEVMFSSVYFNVSLPHREISSTVTTHAMTTSTATGGITSASTGTITTAAQTATTQPTTSGEPSTSGLSHGAAGGIGAGVTVGSLLVLSSLGFMLWRRRRKSRREADNEDGNRRQEQQHHHQQEQEQEPVQVTPKVQTYGGWEKPGTVMAELDGGPTTIVHEKA
ncbi:MYND finger domain-containing protein [Purpureocillium lavendulum]|uniref:MYND finger domain-containing protein n=1 Tax=Purpureocillium lavendulum TaxID=1247861 RepID=A0AB34FP81_9HYPO|nr:MYND finger domain-containing protein [Purpureocillium lavendulum]